MFDKPIDYIALVVFVLATYFFIVSMAKLGRIRDAGKKTLEYEYLIYLILRNIPFQI